MSNSNNNQNGPQPLSSQQPSTSLDRAPVSSERQVCRMYVWGTCTKHSQCKFRHELNIEEMKTILKFCHDHQNRTGCTREDCSYLHTTKEEENLFRTSGVIPQVLAERHAAMAAMATMTNEESVPQIAMFIESFRNPARPPPPPPPSVPGCSTWLTPSVPPVVAPSPAVAPPQVVACPPPPPPPPPRPAPIPSTSRINKPPPPPPPPPSLPSTSNSFNGIPMNGPSSSYFNHPPPALPLGFDASVPPPPLPGHIKPQSASKHKLPDRNDAGPNKLRKPDDCNLPDGPCYNCIQAELRIELYKQQAERLQAEDEHQSLTFKRRMEDNRVGKKTLIALVGLEMFRILEDYIEGPQMDITDILEQQSQTSLVSSRHNNILLELLECFVGNRNYISPAPPIPDPINSLSTRHLSPTTSPNELVTTVLELFRNSNINTERQLSEYRNSDPSINENRPSTSSQRPNGSTLTNSATSSLNAHIFSSSLPNFLNNTLMPNTNVISPIRPSTSSTNHSENALNQSRNEYSSSIAVAVSGLNHTERFLGPSNIIVRPPSTLTQLGANSSGLSTSAAVPMTQGAASGVYIPSFHPTVPPPVNRPLYPPYPNNLVRSTQTTQNTLNPAGGVTLPQPSTQSPAAPSQPPANNFVMGRYPPYPGYYPPYQ